MDKKFEVVYLPIAAKDLDEIIDYIILDSEQNALNMVDKFDSAISKLELFPYEGVVPKDNRLQNMGYRVLIVESYLAFYVVKEKVVEIRRIIHGKRNYGFLL